MCRYPIPGFLRSLILPPYQFVRVKAEVAGDPDELGVAGLVDRRCPGHDPEVIAIGRSDNHRPVIPVEIEDPVVSLGLRGDEYRKPVVEADLEPGVRLRIHHPGPPADGYLAASRGVTLVENGDLARLQD